MGISEYFKLAAPKNWNGDMLILRHEILDHESRPVGKTILKYGKAGNERTIILSNIIGILSGTKPEVFDDKVVWRSGHGEMITDGKAVWEKNDEIQGMGFKIKTNVVGRVFC